MFSLLLLQLSLQDILADIPRDAGAVLVYVLLAAFLAAIWLGSRKRPEDPPAGGR